MAVVISGSTPGARVPHVEDDSAWDRILLPEDLPSGWRIIYRRYPGELRTDASDELDVWVGYDGGWHNQGERDEQRRKRLADDWRLGRWKYILHEETRTRVLLRLGAALPPLAPAPGEMRITGIVLLPGRAGDRVQSNVMRKLALSKIEANINRRYFSNKELLWSAEPTKLDAKTQHRDDPHAVELVMFPLSDGTKVTRVDLMKPLVGDPRTIPLFYERVAHQYTVLSDRRFFTKAGIRQDPMRELAALNKAPLSTARSWVGIARHKGLLPPVRPGWRRGAKPGESNGRSEVDALEVR